jgi:hypothetical protein
LKSWAATTNELTQFVNDLRTNMAEMHDPRASLVRVPLALASTRVVSARLGPKRRQESAPRDSLAITRRARGTDTRRLRS